MGAASAKTGIYSNSLALKKAVAFAGRRFFSGISKSLKVKRNCFQDNYRKDSNFFSKEKNFNAILQKYFISVTMTVPPHTETQWGEDYFFSLSFTSATAFTQLVSRENCVRKSSRL